jgi:hypothetical protein
MDSFNFYDIKVEKANAMLKHRQLQKIANLFRVIEVCVVLLLISRLSMQLPLAVRNSGGYFRDLTVVLASPRFVFVVGNAIVITLFAKSGQFSARDSTRKTSGFDLCEEFIKNTEKNQKVHPDETTGYLDKHATCVESTVKDYRRTQSYSQNSTSRVCEKSRRVLRLSETQMFRSSSRSCEGLAKNSSPDDEISDEDFQRKVEAFIAQQQRFRREEEEEEE